MARIPILLFQAVQGTLLPKLAGLAGAGRHDDFRAGLKRMLWVVVGVAALGSFLAFTLGPVVGKILFKDFDISNANLGLLATGSGAFIVALTVAQALIALEGHARQTLGWFVGMIVFLLVVATIPDLFLRVELGFLIGSLGRRRRHVLVPVAAISAAARPATSARSWGGWKPSRSRSE